MTRCALTYTATCKRLLLSLRETTQSKLMLRATSLTRWSLNMRSAEDRGIIIHYLQVCSIKLMESVDSLPTLSTQKYLLKGKIILRLCLQRQLVSEVVKPKLSNVWGLLKMIRIWHSLQPLDRLHLTKLSKSLKALKDGMVVKMRSIQHKIWPVIDLVSRK
jgi:hypothetical protein